jgi:hypothetical protein
MISGGGNTRVRLARQADLAGWLRQNNVRLVRAGQWLVVNAARLLLAHATRVAYRRERLPAHPGQ